MDKSNRHGTKWLTKNPSRHEMIPAHNGTNYNEVLLTGSDIHP